MARREEKEEVELSEERKRESAETEAFELLRLIITLGRNNKPYKHLLPRLRELLPSAPGIAAIIADRKVE